MITGEKVQERLTKVELMEAKWSSWWLNYLRVLASTDLKA